MTIKIAERIVRSQNAKRRGPQGVKARCFFLSMAGYIHQAARIRSAAVARLRHRPGFLVLDGQALPDQLTSRQATRQASQSYKFARPEQIVIVCNGHDECDPVDRYLIAASAAE